MSTDSVDIDDAPLDDETPVSVLIERYRAGAGLLREAIAGMDAEQLLATPIEGKWSSHDVVCHTADCEQFLADRMKRIVVMERPLLMGADGWAYPETLQYAKRDLTLDLALVEATRAQMAGDLDRLGIDAWDRMAVHSEDGLLTLRQLLLHTVMHLEWHVETIREKRAALGLE